MSLGQAKDDDEEEENEKFDQKLTKNSFKFSLAGEK